MATLPTLALGTYTNISNTTKVGADPALQEIASAVDTSYVYDDTNSSHTGSASFTLEDMPADFGTMATLNVRLRYHWDTYDANKEWTTLAARVFQSNGTTALTDQVTVASAITTTTLTNSSVIPFTGLDTASGKAIWTDAVVHIFWVINRIKGGAAAPQPRVTAAELTGTYNTSAQRSRAIFIG